MPDIDRFETIQAIIRLAREIGRRRLGVRADEARALMAEPGARLLYPVFSTRVCGPACV